MSRSPLPFRPVVESLEERSLLTGTLVLDFSPDHIRGETFHGERLADEFQSGMQRHRLFLDFNHDGRVNRADVAGCISQVVTQTQAYLAGFDVSIQWGDIGGNRNLGQRLLRQARRTGQLLDVMYVGGNSPDGDISTFGEAFQAPVGYNYSYYGYAYFSNMVDWYQRNRPFAAPEQFAKDVAATCAHEFAHMLGLGHPEDAPPGDTNIMNHDADINVANFPNRTYPSVILYDTNDNRTLGPQNPAQELQISLAGQPLFNTAGLLYSAGGSTGGHRVAVTTKRHLPDGLWFDNL